VRRNGATCGAAATATPSRDAQATTSQSAHGHNRSRSTGKMHGLFFHRLTAFEPALFLAQGVARRADLFWFRDDVVSRCCMARVVAFDSESVLCRVRSLCIMRAHADRVRSSFFTRRIASCGNDRTTSPSGLPRRQPGNSKLHFASTRVRYARNPASSPSSPANSAWRPLFASLWRPSRPVLTARGPCVSPPTIALSPGSTRAAARDGRRVEKGLEARTHVSSPSPHLTLLRLIAAVVTPLLDDPSPGSVRPEDRDPSLGAVSDRSRPPALDPDLDHIGFASPRPEATTGNATTTTNTNTDSTTTTTTTGPARKKHSQCGRQFGQRWPLDSWLPRARGDGPARRRDRGWRAPP